MDLTEDNHMKTAKKPVKILLIAIASLLLILIAIWGTYLIDANRLRFDHKGYTEIAMDSGNELYGLKPTKVKENFNVKYPFFGNIHTLSDPDRGYPGFDYPYLVSDKYFPAYMAVNNPILSWANHLHERFEGCNIDYTLEQTDKRITVVLSGTVNDGEKDVPYEQRFVFDIEDPKPGNPPKWINEDEAEEGFREYCEYMSDPQNTPKPNW